MGIEAIIAAGAGLATILAFIGGLAKTLMNRRRTRDNADADLRPTRDSTINVSASKNVIAAEATSMEYNIRIGQVQNLIIQSLPKSTDNTWDERVRKAFLEMRDLLLKGASPTQIAAATASQRRLFEEALHEKLSPISYAVCQFALGTLYVMDKDWDSAQAHWLVASKGLSELDPAFVPAMLSLVGFAREQSGDEAGGRARLTEAVDLLRACDGPLALRLLAAGLAVLASSDFRAGDREAAFSKAQESLAIADSLDDPLTQRMALRTMVVSKIMSDNQDGMLQWCDRWRSLAKGSNLPDEEYYVLLFASQSAFLTYPQAALAYAREAESITPPSMPESTVKAARETIEALEAIIKDTND
jgi:hypothetical protein